MHRFRIVPIGEGNTILLSDAAQLHHLRDVARLGVGDEVVVFDDSGNESLCVVEKISNKDAVLTVKTRGQLSISATTLTIACAIPKKGMDDVIDKLTQLGVKDIIPVITERVVVRFAGENAQRKVSRWRRLALSAAEQSQRNTIPYIWPVTDLNEVISHFQDYDLKLIPNLSGNPKSIVEVMAGLRPKNILVMIGPEGDFTAEEVELAKNVGFVPVSLGRLVLRVDTAAAAVAAYIRISLGI